MTKVEAQLVVLSQQMAEHTLSECAKCRLPFNCCSPEYCIMSMQYAENEWGVKLEATGHARLPLMGKDGCVAPPHLRPLCTLHTCEVNSIGFKKNDPKWTEQYFALREQMEVLENQRHEDTKC